MKLSGARSALGGILGMIKKGVCNDKRQTCISKRP